MNADELRTILQEYTLNQTQFWERKMTEWQNEMTDRQTHLQKKLEELEKTVTNNAFASAVPSHSSPRAVLAEKQTPDQCHQQQAGTSTENQLEPPAPTLAVPMFGNQVTEERSDRRPSVDAGCQIPPEHPRALYAAEETLLGRQTEGLDHRQSQIDSHITQGAVVGDRRQARMASEPTFSGNSYNAQRSAPPAPSGSRNQADEVESHHRRHDPATHLMLQGKSEASQRATEDVRRRTQIWSGPQNYDVQHPQMAVRRDAVPQPWLRPQMDPATAPGRNFNPGVVQPFDGTASWTDYETQFEIVANFQGWTETEKAHGLAMQLRGEALSILSAMPRGKPLAYEVLRGLLRQRYSLDDHTSYTLLRSRLQRPKESLAEFAIQLQRLAMAAFPAGAEKVVEEIVLSQFIDGIRDEQIQNLVAVGRPRNLQEALRMAQEMTSRLERRGHRTVFTASATSNSNRRGNRRNRTPTGLNQNPSNQAEN